MGNIQRLRNLCADVNRLRPLNQAYCLHSICEANFHKLLRLVPALRSLPDRSVARVTGKPALFLSVLERAPYTLTLELSHCFEKDMQAYFEPAVTLRVYLDAESIEVLHTHNRPSVSEACPQYPNIQATLNYKWSLNYFLEKWLQHCLQYGYRFGCSLVKGDQALLSGQSMV